MVTMGMLREARPAIILESARAWAQVAAIGDSTAEECRRTCLHQLESWRGAVGWIARAKTRALVDELHAMPGKCRAIAGALHELHDEVKAAYDRLHAALDEAGKHGIEVDADGQVAAPESRGARERDGGRVEADRLDRIRREIAESVAAASRADQACRDRIEAALSGVEWYEERALSPEHIARLLERASLGDQRALAELREHQDLFADPYFAKELLQAIGPKQLLELPGFMSVHREDVFPEGRLDAGSGELLGMLSDALAAGTDPENPAWEAGELDRYLDALTREGDSTEHRLSAGSGTYPGYWGLGQILGASDGDPPYSAAFMREVGNDMIAWDRRQSETHEGWPATAGPYATEPGVQHERPGNVTTDPLVGLMHAASGTPEGAQAILTRDNLDYLITERDNWADQGNGLGEAIEAGASGYDETSKRIAAQSVDLLADHAREYLEPDGDGAAMTISANPDGLSGLRDSMANVLTTHIDDVNAAIIEESRIEDGKYGLLGYDSRSVPFDTSDLAYVMTDIAGDDRAYERLIHGQIDYLSTSAERLAGEDWDRRDRAAAVVTSLNDTGRVLGFMTEAHAAAEQAAGRAADHPSQQLADLVRKGVGLVDPPAGGLGKAMGVVQPGAVDWIASHVETQHELQAFSHIQSDKEAKEVLVQQVIERTVVEHELYRDKAGADRSFMDGGQFKAMDTILADDRLHWDFNEWARGEANEIRRSVQGVGTKQIEGWDAYREKIGLARS